MVSDQSANLLSLAFLAPANQSLLLVGNDDGSNVNSSLCFTHGLFACPALPWTRSVEGRLSPLYGLMASRYRRGYAFTWHLQGRDSRPHGSLSCQGSA
ncbi:MAG: hypothetical protein U7123_00415 [Potamolinea sp.]